MRPRPTQRRPRDKRGIGYNDKDRPQFNEYGQQIKPDAWKEYGLTKREREERAARPPGTDDYGSSLAQSRHPGANLWAGSGGKREGGGGFVMPPKPPYHTVDVDGISNLDLNEGRSVAGGSNTNSTEWSEANSQSFADNPETPRQEEDLNGHSLGPDGFPDWHRPFSLKKVKKDLRKHDRQEWRAPVSAERPAVEEIPTSIFNDLDGAGVPLSAYIKPPKQKKKKRGQDQKAHADSTGNAYSSHDDFASDFETFPATETFESLHISDGAPLSSQTSDTTAVHHPNTLPVLSRESHYPGSQQVVQSSTKISIPKADNTFVTAIIPNLPPSPPSSLPPSLPSSLPPSLPSSLPSSLPPSLSPSLPPSRPPNLPPKPKKVISPAPPPLSLFAQSRPIVKAVTANGVITTDSQDLNLSQPIPKLAFITREILGTSFNGIPNGYYEEQQVCTKTGKILTRTLKRTAPDTTVEPKLLPPDGLKGLVQRKREEAERKVRSNMVRTRLPAPGVVYGPEFHGNPSAVSTTPRKAPPLRPQDILRERERRNRENEERRKMEELEELERKRREAEEEERRQREAEEHERRQREAEEEDLITFSDSD